jgi:hypothetical protein
MLEAMLKRDSAQNETQNVPFALFSEVVVLSFSRPNSRKIPKKAANFTATSFSFLFSFVF